MLPVTTTTVTVRRPAADCDPYEAETFATIASGVPADLSDAGGSSSLVGGAQDKTKATFYVPPSTDVVPGDQFVDERTATVWTVLATIARDGFGLGHVKVDCVETVGAHDG